MTAGLGRWNGAMSRTSTKRRATKERSATPSRISNATDHWRAPLAAKAKHPVANTASPTARQQTEVEKVAKSRASAPNPNSEICRADSVSCASRQVPATKASGNARLFHLARPSLKASRPYAANTAVATSTKWRNFTGARR